MDTAALAQNVVAFLAPFLPYLVKAGEGAAKEAGKKFTGEAWERAQGLWNKLRPKVEEKPAAQEVVQDLAKDPNDRDLQAALRVQLKKLLSEDQDLAQEISALFAEAKEAGVTVTASGERSVAIGGSVSGSTITTGDQSTAEAGKQDELDEH